MPTSAPAANTEKVQTFFHRDFDASSSEAEQHKPTDAGSDASAFLTQNLSVLIQDLVDHRSRLAALGMCLWDIEGDYAEGDYAFLEPELIDAVKRVDGLVQDMGGLTKSMERLAAEKQAQAERIAELEAKIAELETAQAEPAAVSDTGEEYVSWVEFEAAAISAFGRDAWKSVAAFEMDMDVKTLNAWQTVGVIPAKFRGRGEGFDRRPKGTRVPQAMGRHRVRAA